MDRKLLLRIFFKHYLKSTHWYSDKQFGGGEDSCFICMWVKFIWTGLEAFLYFGADKSSSVRTRESNVKKVSPALRRATIITWTFHFPSDTCFLPLCHHDSASWHAERSSRWKQCRAVLGWCGLPWLFCAYLIYCTSYFLFPCLSAARHVLLSSASAWPCVRKRAQGCPGCGQEGQFALRPLVWEAWECLSSCITIYPAI